MVMSLRRIEHFRQVLIPVEGGLQIVAEKLTAVTTVHHAHPEVQTITGYVAIECSLHVAVGH